MCFYLSALFAAAVEIQNYLADGVPVVVESYFARCLATHRAFGTRLGVTLPRCLPQPITYQLVCCEGERQRRLAQRSKSLSRWDELGEKVADAITDAYAQFPMQQVDTTGLRPDQVVQTILATANEGASCGRPGAYGNTPSRSSLQFLAALKDRASADATVAVVGASDGKFVLPLAAAGYRVVAIERDPVALYGGEVILPGDTHAHAVGLIDRLKLEGFNDRVQVVEEDFLQADSWVAVRCRVDELLMALQCKSLPPTPRFCSPHAVPCPCRRPVRRRIGMMPVEQRDGAARGLHVTAGAQQPLRHQLAPIRRLR
ncbi:hypothetical protein SANTM175S_01851 [Streptomyces antimycoticus]